MGIDLPPGVLPDDDTDGDGDGSGDRGDVSAGGLTAGEWVSVLETAANGDTDVVEDWVDGMQLGPALSDAGVEDARVAVDAAVDAGILVEDDGLRVRVSVKYSDVDAVSPDADESRGGAVNTDQRGGVLPQSYSRGDYGHLLRDDDGDSDGDEYPAWLTALLEDAVDYMQGELWDRPDRVEWLQQKYGMTEETIREKQLGWIPDDDDLVAYLRECGYSDGAIVASGLVSESAVFSAVYPTRDVRDDEKRPDRWSDVGDGVRALAAVLRDGHVDHSAVDVRSVTAAVEDSVGYVNPVMWWSNRVVMPYFNADGDPVMMIARKTDSTADTVGKYAKMYCRDPIPVSEPLYGVDTVDDDTLSVVVTEGITDAMLCHQHDISAVSPVTNTLNDQKDAVERVSRCVDKMYIVFDNEKSEAGQKGAINTAEAVYDVVESDLLIGSLPRPDGWDKIDCAAYLGVLDNDKQDFGSDVIVDATPVEDHPDVNTATGVDVPASVLATQSQSLSDSYGGGAGGDGNGDIPEDVIMDALDALDPDLHNDEWQRVGFALGSRFSSPKAKRVFRDWSRNGQKWDDEAQRRADNIVESANGSVGAESILWLAQERAGWSRS